MRTALAAAVALSLIGAAAQAQGAADDFARGVELRKAARPAEAIPALEAASRARPDDADVWLNLGLAYAAAGRLDAAEPALGEAARISPDYPDVRIARARIAYFRQDIAEAERRLAPVLAATPANAEARELAAALAAARADVPARWRLDAAVSGAELSGGLPSERGGSIALTRAFGGGRFSTASLEHRRRFGREDTYGEVILGGRLGYLGFGATPEADFRPEWTVRAGLSAPPRALADGWSAGLGLDAAWARYPVGDVRTLTPLLTLSKGEALTLTGRWINVIDERDEHRAGYSLRAAWRAAPRLQVSAGWADAPESSDGATVQVRAVTLGLGYDVGPRTTLRMDAAREERAAYDRDELTVGVTRRF